MQQPFFRIAAVLGAVLAVAGIGIWYLGGNDHLGIPWLLAANALVGAIQMFRLYPVSLGLEHGSFYTRAQAVDLAWLAAVQFGGAVVVALVLGVGGSPDVSLIWMPFFVLAVGFGLGFVGGLLVGMVVLVPAVTVVAALFARLTGRTPRGDVLGSLLIFSIFPPAVLGALAMEFDFSHPKAAAWALIFALAGPILPGVEVRSELLLWLGRAWFVALIVFIVLTARRENRRSGAREAGRGTQKSRGERRTRPGRTGSGASARARARADARQSAREREEREEREELAARDAAESAAKQAAEQAKAERA